METLKAWRTAHELTIPQAAHQVGVKRATWWRWERGVRPVGLPSIDQIEEVTGIPREELRPDIFGRRQVTQ